MARYMDTTLNHGSYNREEIETVHTTLNNARNIGQLLFSDTYEAGIVVSELK